MSISQRLIVLALLGLTLSSSYADDCQFYEGSKCECAFSDGFGYNLKPLLDGSKYMEAYSEDFRYLFSPCADIKEVPAEWNATDSKNQTKNECKDNGYSLCVYSIKDQTFTVLGTQKDLAIEGDIDDKKVRMTFTKQKDSKSSVTLECSETSDTSALFVPKEAKINDSHLLLFSSLSCRTKIYDVKQPGFFSTFFLVLFIMFLLYLVFGMLYQYFLVGARGYEILPNYDFWSKAWMSIKLGFIYIKNGCRVIPTEDSYDAI